MSELYLVRHGQASFGTADYDRLSALGEEQAALLAEHLAAIARRIDVIHSGPLRRQRATAEIIARTLAARGAPAVEIIVCDDLAEYDAEAIIAAFVRSPQAPPWVRERLERPARLERSRFQRLLEAAGRAWVRGEIGGERIECWPAFKTRTARALESMRRAEGRGRAVLVSSSAGVIGALIGRILDLGDEAALAASWPMYNTALSHVRFDERRLTLASFNSVGHLERVGRPELLTYR